MEEIGKIRIQSETPGDILEFYNKLMTFVNDKSKSNAVRLVAANMGRDELGKALNVIDNASDESLTDITMKQIILDNTIRQLVIDNAMVK